MKPKPRQLRFTRIEAMHASEEWGFNCGPAAVCAVFELTPFEVRPYLAGFEAKRYTNPTLMREILDRLGAAYLQTYRCDEPIFATMPIVHHGLVRIQWSGPWTKPGVPMKARYRQTHWVAMRAGSTEVFDINTLFTDGLTSYRGGWISRQEWMLKLVPDIIRSCVPKADGGWWPTHAFEISR